MLIPKQHHVKDKNYRKSFKDESCWSCGTNDGTVIGAHIRKGSNAGMGRKPSDDLVLPLCFRCHSDQEDNPGAEWWLENVLKPIAQRRYQMFVESK